MRVLKTIAEVRQHLTEERRLGLSIGFVPTMGALHHGHLALVQKAREMCDRVLVSIFVNPKQFGSHEDFEVYPRDLLSDCTLLNKEAVEYVFAPSVEEMWPLGNDTIVEVEGLSRILMGELRPGHFCGVTSVVAKLFNIVQPDKVFFGEKDFQQLLIIRRMVKDLAFPIEVIGVPILRDSDGVASSSRNQLLTPEDRKAAKIIPESGKAAEKLYRQGERSVDKLCKAVRDILQQELRAIVESVDLRNMETLSAIKGTLDAPAVLLLTVRFGDVRLIDQYILQ
ncbi:pantothenate synthetase [Bartonella bacilliformis Peru38]|uniref:Pantothenate synthetase n=2 Tax=Bartonella bacilliformis TaxID=774 RepID=PANC_BARBK|nr:pantoate--beta-alanine ligase [Bartonella bacilliformis]A1US39.1 RecName: Full=Pantothenate synthetase; Short=PS; AltName: Full=Pantoate--beta-alanine ligase; AltName: Full=Pantoate-activating enzyme [Bartonella bacilliformis KC583]ABM45328.1 pantoate--beta-alanine ligase [Bartonella bacilliformis KC583]AMG85625.1 pantoate--beta-alanine ligase [Bartonella bacilliformis]EKS45041.1 pantoate--beta-alanine ligase [Bartonella bacilliformis INS]EYS90080.1 pantothenate synthetase [Bartonella bacil